MGRTAGAKMGVPSKGELTAELGAVKADLKEALKKIELQEVGISVGFDSIERQLKDTPEDLDITAGVLAELNKQLDVMESKFDAMKKLLELEPKFFYSCCRSILNGEELHTALIGDTAKSLVADPPTP